MTLTDSWPCRELLPLPWIQFPHCDYADDIALTSNTVECLQFQLNKFHNYTRFKRLKLNTDKTKVMVFFRKGNSAIPTFTYDGTGTCHWIQIPWNHSYSWWKHAHSYWEDGRQLQVCHCQSLQNWWQQGYAMAFPGLCFDSWSVRLSSMAHFFSDKWFLKNHLHTYPSPGLPEKTPGCQERYYTHSVRAPRNKSDAHLFLLVQMHHTILVQFTLFKQSSSWESCAGWLSHCK